MAAAVGLALAWAACGCPGDEPAPRGREAPAPWARDAVPTSQTATTAPRWSARYYDAYLSDIIGGDIAQARETYREVMTGADNLDPVLAARAALQLAALEARAGRRREAVELVARAMALGGRDPDVVVRADALQVRLASVRTERPGVRGPPVGTQPEGISQEAARGFASAEQLLAAFYDVDVKPRLEDLQAGVRARQRAVESAVRAYREVVDLGEPAATAAAELRIATLYHDLAIAMVFDLPPELERGAASRLRRQFRAKAVAFLRRARDAYRHSLAEVRGDAEGERWRRAAEQGLGAVDDLLRGGE